jgi:tetratricopeptide (TPR) repeat protein
LKINPQFIIAIILMGNLLFESGYSKNAIKYFMQALKINPKEMQAIVGIANAYYDSGQTEKAIEYYKKAI